MTQLVFSTPHRPRRRMGRWCVRHLGHVPSPLLTAHSTCSPSHQRDGGVGPPGGHPLPPSSGHHTPQRPLRDGGAEMWLRQADMVCGSVLTSPLSYEEGSEVVCGGVGWGRTAQSPSHQKSNSTMYSSVMWNNLRAMGTLQNTTHHYIPRLLPSPRERTTPNTPVAVNAHFSYECHSLEEYRPKSGIPREAVGDPPPTQQLVSGKD